MNMLMHGVDYQNFDIYKGDTLTNDMYGDDLKLTVQVCNPPYSLKWSADSKYLDDPRYSGVGKLAPKSHADLAFLQHMIYHMDETDGRVAVLLPLGVLFRGGAEEEIRKYLIKDLNRLDAVIGLPANLFHGASIPVVVLVLKSKRNGNGGSSYPAWGRTTFAEAFTAINNNTFSRDMLNYENGAVKNIHYGDILIRFGDICDIQKDSIPFVNEDVNTSKYARLKNGDIILADTAEDETVGKAIEIFNADSDEVISAFLVRFDLREVMVVSFLSGNKKLLTNWQSIRKDRSAVH